MTYPAAPAAVLFAAPARGRSHQEVAAALRASGLRVGERLGGDLPKRNPDTGAPLPLLPCPFAAIALAHGPAEETVPMLRARLAGAVPMIDIAGSVLLVGTEHVVKPGDGAILVTMLTRRRADFTAASYRDRWLGEHAPFGLRIGASGYRQLHGDDPHRFDGVGMVCFRDLDHAASARAAPEVARDATRDEMQFVDHGGSMLAMFRLLS
jgi:hypothetical protein